MYSAGQRDRVKHARIFILYGTIITTVSLCLSALGVVSTVYWYTDGYTDTFYFTGAFVCGIPGLLLGMMYFWYYHKSRRYTNDVDKFTAITRNLINFENHISRLTLVVFALGLYSVPMAITGIIKHADDDDNVHLVFSLCIMLVCLLLFAVGAFSCFKFTARGMRVKTKKGVAHALYNSNHGYAGSDSGETVFTVVTCNCNCGQSCNCNKTSVPITNETATPI